MRLTVENDRETIKRYAHIKPARGWRTSFCSAECTGTAYACTRELGHRGHHVAHGRFGKVVAVWDAGRQLRMSGETTRRAVEASSRKAARRVRPRGMLDALSARVIAVFSNMEEIVFGVMFIAFVWFAIDWLLMIFG